MIDQTKKRVNLQNKKPRAKKHSTLVVRKHTQSVTSLFHKPEIKSEIPFQSMLSTCGSLFAKSRKLCAIDYYIHYSSHLRIFKASFALFSWLSTRATSVHMNSFHFVLNGQRLAAATRTTSDAIFVRRENSVPVFTWLILWGGRLVFHER